MCCIQLASQTSICDEGFGASAFCISWADDSSSRFLLVMVGGQKVVGPWLIYCRHDHDVEKGSHGQVNFRSRSIKLEHLS